MEEENKEVEKTAQQMIREMGELVHADEELNQDGLPVYFRIALPGKFWLIVDLERKDEIGIDCPNKGYKVVNQIVADLVFEIALAHIDMEQEVEELRKRSPSPLTIPLLPTNPYGDNTGDWRKSPYDITCIGQPHVLEPEEIPEGTTIAGEDNDEKR